MAMHIAYNVLFNRLRLKLWFSTGGSQHVSRVGHGRLCSLKMGLHAEYG